MISVYRLRGREVTEELIRVILDCPFPSPEMLERNSSLVSRVLDSIIQLESRDGGGGICNF